MPGKDDKPRPGKRPEGGGRVGSTTRFDPSSIAELTTGEDDPVATLSVVAGSQAGMTVPLTDLPLVCGRHQDCDVMLTGRGISRQHFRIERDDAGHPVIVDLKSTNGVFVNGVQVRRRTLQEGDRLALGPSTALRFSYEDTTEITIRRRKYDESIRDELTGCFNRRHFDQVLEHEIAYSRRHGEALSVLLLDIDRFKRINDQFGHQSGDHVLQRVVTRLSKHLREEDLFARYGGEEFAVVLRGQDAAGAWETAERLRRQLAGQTFQVGADELEVTVSIGIATLGPEALGQSASAMIGEADERLYAAKEGGRNRTVGSAPPAP